MNLKGFNISEVQERRASAAKVGDQIEVSLSSETPVERVFGPEVLSHAAGAVDMSRINDGSLPMLINHNADRLAGRLEGFRVDGGKTRATPRFDTEDPDALRWKSKLDQRIATDFSMRYRILDYEIRTSEEGREFLFATRWQPVEGSIVSIGADPNVGAGRSLTTEEEHKMPRETTTGNDTGKPTGEINVLEFKREVEAATAAGQAAGVQLENARQTAINEAFEALQPRYRTDLMRSLQKKCIGNPLTSADQARTAILELINGEAAGGEAGDPGAAALPPQGDTRARPATAPGLDDMEKFRDGVTQALEIKWGIEKDPQKRSLIWQNPYGGLSLLELSRTYLEKLGIPAGGMHPPMVVKRMMRATGKLPQDPMMRSAIIANSTSDFVGILSNIAFKQLGTGYNQAPETWRPLVYVMSMPDYKEGEIPSLTSFEKLLEIPKSGKYEHGELGEVSEKIKMRKFGRLFSLSREAILNDDQSAFTRIPQKMGLAAARVPGDLFWNEIIIANPVLAQNSKNLFSADNKNLVTPGTAPTIAALDASLAKMRLQEDPHNRQTMNVVPAYIMVPAELEGTARQLTTAVGTSDQSPGSSGEMMITRAENRFAFLEPVVEPRLSKNSTKKWYLSANPNAGIVDTVAMAFLNGQETPFMEEEEGFDQDGITYKVRLEVTAAPIAYQGLLENAGGP